MDMEYITTFTMKIRLRLDEGQVREANKALNRHYIGHETFAAGDKASTEHINASYEMQAAQYVTVTVGMLPSGTLEIIHEH